MCVRASVDLDIIEEIVEPGKLSAVVLGQLKFLDEGKGIRAAMLAEAPPRQLREPASLLVISCRSLVIDPLNIIIRAAMLAQPPPRQRREPVPP